MCVREKKKRMLTLWIALLIAIHAPSVAGYLLVDTGFNTPLCSRENPLAQVDITNNVIGNSLALHFTVTSKVALYSCRLCKMNTSYCNRSLLDTEYEIRLGEARVRVLGIKESNQTLDYTANTSPLRNNTIIVSLDASGQCQRTLRLVLTLDVILTTSQIQENITLASYTDVSLSTAPIECQLLEKYSMGLNCNVTPFIQPLSYQLSNCLVAQDSVLPETNQPSLATSRRIHSPLYWYAQFLKNESLVARHSAESLCGEPPHTILYRSDLYLSHCAANHESQEARSAWYRMAVQVVTVVCNDVPDEYKWIWLHAVEILERHCDLRESELSKEASTPNSLFMVILNRLDEANQFNVAKTGGENVTLLCREIETHFNATFDATMSQSLYNQWYYKGFKYLLVEDENMKLYATLLIVAFCLIPFVIIGLIGNAIWHLKNVSRPKKLVLL